MSESIMPKGIIRDPSSQDLYIQTEELRQEIAQQVEAIHSDASTQALQAESEHRINLVLERMGANEEKTKSEIDHKFSRYFLYIVLSFVLLLITAGISYFQIFNPQSGQSIFELSEPAIKGSTELCPGESLLFRIDAKVSDPGVYRLAMSTWRVDPPPAVYAFSEGLDMVIAEERDFPIEILWVVPPSFANLATGEKEPWPEGEYSRDISVTATGRNTTSDPVQVKFKIRSDCPKG